MTVVEKKVDPVFLRLDRIIDRALSIDREVLDRELESAGRARIGADFALDFDRSLLCQLPKSIPRFGRHNAFHQYCLKQSGAIAHHYERNFSRRSDVSYPSAESHGLTSVQR